MHFKELLVTSSGTQISWRQSSSSGLKYNCIASKLTSDNSYTSAGLVDEASFTLNLQLPLHKPIKSEDKVTFRGKEYRVGLVEVDSAPAAVRIHLRDLSKP